MKLHVRLSGNRYSFRLRLFDRYVDAGESYASEEDAAFAADVTKHYLRTFFHVTKNVEPSLDGEVFCMLAYRHSVTLSDRSSVESALSPGVKVFLDANRAALDAHAESNRPELRDWEKLRNYDDSAIRNWVNQCDAASVKQAAFACVNGEYLSALLGAVSARLVDCEGPLNRALKMYSRVAEPSLVAHRGQLLDLTSTIASVAALVDSLNSRIAKERTEVAAALPALEANRPPLT